MARYRYQALPEVPGAHPVRLVTIHPGLFNDDMILSLQVVGFTKDLPVYDALSYVWGSKPNSKVVYIGTSDKANLRVGQNLKDALQHLRDSHRERVMWIDALCIDQSNDGEKSSQVALMGQIFARAARVVVWLGLERNASGVAMKCLEDIGSQIDVFWGGLHRISPASDFEEVDLSIADPNSDLPWNETQSHAVAKLLHRSWFDRLWIRQEIFVAEEQAIVCCGPHQMSWTVFRKALRLLYSKRPTPGSFISKAQARLTIIGGLVFQMRWTHILSIRNVFENAICLDPRDRIYGIRALLHGEQQAICGAPDYTISQKDLYLNVAKKYIEAYPDGLTILRHCEWPSLSQQWDGPSWVPDWSTKASSHWRYDSWASSQIGGWFEYPRFRVLRVLGVSTTVVQETRPIPTFYGHDWGLGASFFRSVAGNSVTSPEYPSGVSFVRALARTILSGGVSDFMYVEDGNYPTTDIAEEVLTKVIQGEGLTEDDFIIGSAAQRFFKRMEWGSGGKNFIQGTGGYIGVAPPSARVGDEVYVIVGCQQPILLRRDSAAAAKYSVVGECYIEGYARGEPLLGNLPDHIGFSVDNRSQSSRTEGGVSRCFRDLRTGMLSVEDPRFKDFGVDLNTFLIRLNNEPGAMLTLAPAVLLECIEGLRYIDLI
ncbi:hypothetical protein N0V93_008850 [Gnomoniopsis smithogilvyi]|uniref:Heterokaryon incompatibility domain-containing protein n=1 Tax=Gnomoniopsis smithogilvyi TaxID=1191159 RepID=A0A9W8YNS7_9PEZI|nr:hypothetical protein N0V93_008850 [Gnomoniopsis smithogilvyi]